MLLLTSHASTPATGVEAENGTQNNTNIVTDSGASGGKGVMFGSGAGNTTASNPSADAGASLPISYNLSSLTGTVLYVSPSGSDANSGTVDSPYATLAKAISASSSGGTIVLRGGTYRQGGISINKTLKIVAYPGEIPVFNGATPVSGGWSTSGSLSYRAYTPIPTSNGSGITFTSCQNQTSSCVGQYPDQVWVGTTQLQQVTARSAVTAGTFYVDTTNSQLYMATSDVNQGSVEISGQRTFASVAASHVTLQGFEVIRYSNTPSDYGAITITGTADYATVDEIFESDTAFIAMAFAPAGSDINTNSTLENSTILYSNWMGVSATGTTSLTLDHDNISNMNQFGEFTTSPQSGSLKTSRTWYTKVLNSKIMNDQSQGIWFDESNYDATVAGNDIENNTGTGLFFEISDDLYAANNYIKSSGSARAVKLSASSDLYLVNNTIVGGADPVGVYVDPRSIPGCSDPSQPLCTGALNSNRDNYHGFRSSITWLPSITLFAKNIIAYPSAQGYCSSTNALCITQTNGAANVALTTIIHPADSAKGIPQTVIDGNVYANGSGNIIDTVAQGNFTTLSDFTSTMAGSPVNSGGLEAHGLAGNTYINSDGSPTSLLSAKERSAYPVPTDTNINPYVPAGMLHYGVLWK